MYMHRKVQYISFNPFIVKCVPDKYMKCSPIEMDTDLGTGAVEYGVRGDFYKIPRMGIHINVLLPVPKIKYT